MPKDLIILSVNLQKSHKDLTSVLETTLADILLIQEPSWVQLVPHCSDTDPNGEDTRGSINHPKWNTLFPPMAGLSPDSRPLVATFLCKSTTHLYVVSLLPSFSSLSSLGIVVSASAPVVDQARHEGLDLPSVSAIESITDVSPLGEARETGGTIMVVATGHTALTYAPH